MTGGEGGEQQAVTGGEGGEEQAVTDGEGGDQQSVTGDFTNESSEQVNNGE